MARIFVPTHWPFARSGERSRIGFALRNAALASIVILTVDLLINYALDDTRPQTLLYMASTIAATFFAIFRISLGHVAAIDRLEETRAGLRQSELCDSLTGLGNRRALIGDFGRLDGRADGEPGVFVLIGLDRFRLFNSIHGHEIGDRTLIAVARIIAEELGHVGRLYRTAGTEFVLLGDGESSDDVNTATATLAARIADSDFGLGQGTANLTISVGIARLKPELGFDAVYEAADRALVDARLAGRNSVRTAETTARNFGVIEIDEVAWLTSDRPRPPKATAA